MALADCAEVIALMALAGFAGAVLIVSALDVFVAGFKAVLRMLGRA